MHCILQLGFCVVDSDIKIASSRRIVENCRQLGKESQDQFFFLGARLHCCNANSLACSVADVSQEPREPSAACRSCALIPFSSSRSQLRALTLSSASVSATLPFFRHRSTSFAIFLASEFTMKQTVKYRQSLRDHQCRI